VALSPRNARDELCRLLGVASDGDVDGLHSAYEKQLAAAIQESDLVRSRELSAAYAALPEHQRAALYTAPQRRVPEREVYIWRGWADYQSAPDPLSAESQERHPSRAALRVRFIVALLVIPLAVIGIASWVARASAQGDNLAPSRSAVVQRAAHRPTHPAVTPQQAAHPRLLATRPV
jgi:hypothetical protein